MRSNLSIKAILVAIVLAFGIVKLIPTIKFYSMDKSERAQKLAENDPEFMELKSKILNLGLDLQGGMQVVADIDVREFLIRRAERPDDVLREAVKVAAQDDFAPVATLRSELENKNKSLTQYYGNKRDLKRDTDDKVQPILEDELSKATKQALEIIRNRIDEFGVAEPSIQQLGDRRISVELAGVVDPQRIRMNIQRTAQLDFSTVAEKKDAYRVFLAANEYYRTKYELDKKDSLETKTEEKTNAEDLFGAEKAEENEDSSYDPILFQVYDPENAQEAVISAKNRDLTESLLNDDDFLSYVQRKAGNYRVLFMKPRGLKPGEKPTYFRVIALRTRNEMDGKGIEGATSQIDPQGIGSYIVSMQFDDKSGKKFSRLSERYLGKRLAIILDDVVQSAPVFQSKIPAHSGAQISGMDQQESQDLAIVLRSGALPAPLKIMDEFTVGASLGDDSVQAGKNSILLGFGLVLIFMMVYYKKSGVIASFAVVLNVVLMFGALTAFGGTLTLPGIAGIILTIGMSVDANVLIFERIREEVLSGVTVFQALENGYSRAFVAILDANITTFIAGLVLYAFGSGSIRGFALTLMIGILTSMFTAIVMTKVIFAATTKETETELSI